MWLILQQDVPDDFVIATGVTTTVRDFVIMSFAEVGIEVAFEGEGVNETAKIVKCNNPEYQLEPGHVVLKIDPRYYRPTEVELLIGDPTKSKKQLGWEMEYDLKGLVEDMMTSEIELFKRDQFLLKGGHKILNYHE